VPAVRALISLLAVSLAVASHPPRKKYYQQLTVAPAGIANPHVTVAMGPVVRFKWFEYAGHDTVFDRPLLPGTYRKPVLAGFYPDPALRARATRTIWSTPRSLIFQVSRCF